MLRNSKEPLGNSCGQFFPWFYDTLGFSHYKAHISTIMDDKMLEAALMLVQPKKFLDKIWKYLYFSLTLTYVHSLFMTESPAAFWAKAKSDAVLRLIPKEKAISN